MTTEQQFLADHNRALKADLATAEETIAVLRRQLEQAAAEQEKLAYKCDFLTSEIARITASREQYERVAIRLAAKMEGAVEQCCATFESMKTEIRDAAFTKVPGAAKPEPASDLTPQEVAEVQELGYKFGSGGAGTPAPVNKFQNGNSSH